MPMQSQLAELLQNLGNLKNANIIWPKPVPDLTKIENYFGNKTLYPQTEPVTKYEMQIDTALSPYMRKTLPVKESINAVPVRFRIAKDVVSHVKRILPGSGVLTVKVGQEVTPDEILGTATLPSGFRTVKLARELSVDPKDVAKYLRKNLNQRIYSGELLAFRKEGLFTGKKIVTAPCDGILESLNSKTGELRIAFFPRKINLLSGAYGIVDEIDLQRGEVLIRTEVCRIFGVFGTGPEREGFLHLLGKKDDLIIKRQVQESCEGKILTGGSLFLKESISAAVSGGACGLITGGINASDFKAMAEGGDMGLSVVVCEGFGAVPIGGDIYNILAQFEGRFISVNGEEGIINLPSFSSNSIIKVRRTIVPKGQIIRSATVNDLKRGMIVRIIGYSFFGSFGRVLAVDREETMLPSGKKTILATVETARKKIQIPLANLEIVV